MFRLAFAKTCAFAAIWLEIITLAFWRPFFWFLLFAGLWLYGWPSLLGRVAETFAFLVFVIGLLFLLVRDIRALRWPRKTEIIRRIEIQSALPHRPLSSRNDQPVTDNGLWQRWRMQTQALIKNKIRLPKTMPLLAGRDPYGVRVMILVFVFSALAVAGTEAPARIHAGLTPQIITANLAPSDRLTLTIRPPAYTGHDRIVIRAGGRANHADAITIPRGSSLSAHINGGRFTPSVAYGSVHTDMDTADGETFSFEGDITPGPAIHIRQWPFLDVRVAYTYKPDLPPFVALNGMAETRPDGQLRIPLTIKDDYGVKSLTLSLFHNPNAPAPFPEETYTERRSITSRAGQETNITPVYDLTAHVWAGFPVLMAFEVEDHAGQTFRTAPIALTLPERQFRHPVARHIAEMRKDLILRQDNAFGIARALEGIMGQPDAYRGDISTFLALRVAASRLHYSPESREQALSVIHLMWQIALKIEDGDMGLALQQLRDLQKKLEQALDDPDSTDADIQNLMQALREALFRYMQEMAHEAQKNIQQLDPDARVQTMDPALLEQFLSQMEAELLSGDRDRAADMLADLRDFLDMVQNAQNQPLPPEMQQMQQAMEELRAIRDEQQDLLEQTRNMDADSAEFGMQCEAGGAAQDDLRMRLGDVMRETGEAMGQIPAPMGEAEQEMRQAAQSLEGQDAQSAAQAQERALEQLQNAMDDLGREMVQRMQMMASGQGQTDPFGRPMGPEGNGMFFPRSNIQIPEQGERRRVEEILDTLRRRLGDFQRPEDERDYFRRLLRQF